MKIKTGIIAVLLLLACGVSVAQNPKGYTVRDTLIYHEMSRVDSTLLGVNVFGSMPKNVTVRQSESVRSALYNQVEKNSARMFTGFRIRIFSEGNQSARSESEAAENRFSVLYPGYATYRSYDNPFFKVSVGDFRTKAEAEKALRLIRNDFPDAVIIKERFKYPSLENGRSFRADTLRLLNQGF